MEFPDLAFRRLDDSRLQSSAYIDWAERLLEEGSESPSVAQLASCSWEAEPDPNQIERLFQSCLTELDLSLPADWHQALLAHASSICQKAIFGTLSPWDCMTKILRLADETNEPYILWIWIDLYRDLSHEHDLEGQHIVFNDFLHLQQADECIRETALQFIDLCEQELPLKFPWIWRCEKCEEVCDDNTFSELKNRTCPKCGSAHSMKNMRFYENRQEICRTAR